MREFDFRSAWHELARPAFEALSGEVHDLLASVEVECGDLRQLRDLSMPWPVDVPLKARFEALDSTTLAWASRVVYDHGHWRPGDAPTPSCGGAYWKFSHYADQVLRARLGLSRETQDRGAGYAVHEGVIRLTYGSRDCWTWREVAPATEGGLVLARALGAVLTSVLKGGVREQDTAACKFMDTLVTEWPTSWAPRFEMDRFMVERGAR